MNAVSHWGLLIFLASIIGGLNAWMLKRSFKKSIDSRAHLYFSFMQRMAVSGLGIFVVINIYNKWTEIAAFICVLMISQIIAVMYWRRRL